MITKKYYLGKAFAHEFATKLENNKFTASNSFSQFELTLTQVMPPDLTDTFFHQLLRKLLKEDMFREFMPYDQLLQSLFVLFHIDQISKATFANEVN